MAGFKRSGTAAVSLQVSGLNATRRAARALGDKDAPYVREVLDESGNDLARAARSLGKGAVGRRVSYQGVKGQGFGARAIVKAEHPGSRAAEFGRRFYLTGYKRVKGRAIGGRKIARRGQAAKPFIGVVNQDAAIGQISPRFVARMGDALEREFERVATGGDD